MGSRMKDETSKKTPEEKPPKRGLGDTSSRTDAHRRIYEFLSLMSENEDERFRGIDKKSFSVVSLSAIIMALLSFLSRELPRENTLVCGVAIVIVAIAFLTAFASIVLCIISVWPRSYTHPNIGNYTSDTFLCKDEDKVLLQLISDLEDYYKSNKMRTERKAGFLEWSLILTTTSIGVSLAAVVIFLLAR